MSTKLPPLNALKMFEIAARHLSFTKASEELFVTQAAVSHQIKALEEFLGLKLFRRRNRSLLLTEEGQNYYLELKEIMHALRHATDKLKAASTKGTLTVSVPPSFAIQWLVPRLSSFNQNYPDIDVRIQAVDHYEGKLSESVDVGVFYGQGDWPNLQVDLLYSEYLLPLAAPSFVLEKQLLNQPNNLKNCTLLHDISRQNWLIYTRHFGFDDINVQQGPIFSHSAMVVQAAVHSQGIALVNNVLAQTEIASGRLVCPFYQVLIGVNAFYFAYPKNQPLIGKAAAFRDWILTTATSEQQNLDVQVGRIKP